MSKGKLAKFADMATYDNVFQFPYGALEHADFPLRGRWHEAYFHNQNPIVLEPLLLRRSLQENRKAEKA